VKEHEITRQAREHFQKTINTMSDQLSTVRASRVSPAILEPVTVEYEGAKYKLSELAMVVAQDARTLIIETMGCFHDPSHISLVAKGERGC